MREQSRCFDGSPIDSLSSHPEEEQDGNHLLREQDGACSDTLRAPRLSPLLFALALIEDPDSFRPPFDSNKLNTKKQDQNLESFDFFDVLNFEQSTLPAPSFPHLKARTRNHKMARGAAATTRSSSGAAAAAPAPEEVGEFFFWFFRFLRDDRPCLLDLLLLLLLLSSPLRASNTQEQQQQQ